jgi:hypothetical protein
MNLTLTINSQDYGFVIEAIKLRTMSMIESLDVQKYQQEGAAIQNIPHPTSPFSEAPVKQEGAPVSFAGEVVTKKPHWTQTAKGRKIMATRKRKGQK